MTKIHPRVSRHYLQYRLVAIYGSVYFATLVIASILFIKMVTSKFFHPLFWGWCFWTFVTAYWFFIFMRAVLSPAIQVYPNRVILNYPKRRIIPSDRVTSFKVNDTHVEVSFLDNEKTENLRIGIRKSYDVD